MLDGYKLKLEPYCACCHSFDPDVESFYNFDKAYHIIGCVNARSCEHAVNQASQQIEDEKRKKLMVD